MLARIGSTDQSCRGGPAAGGNENAVLDDELALPGAAVIGAQVDETVSVDSAVLHDQRPKADGVDPRMAQRRIADRGVGDPLMGIKTREGALVEKKVLAEVRAHNSPAAAILDVVDLAAVHEGNGQCPIHGNVVGAHAHRLSG